MTAAAVLALRVLLATAFLLAVAGKLRDMAAFAQAVAGLAGTSAAASRRLARAVVAAEVAAVALLLAWPAGTVPAFAFTALLLAAFSAALVSGLRRPLALSCNCFGASERPISPWDLARNGLLVACALAGAVLAAGQAPGHLPRGDLLLTALPGVALGMLVSHLHDVAGTLGGRLVR